MSCLWKTKEMMKRTIHDSLRFLISYHSKPVYLLQKDGKRNK